MIGIPNPGVELKLVPNAGKLEARLKSPSITPGYWRQPELTTKAFDEEGYYLLGDALKFLDPDDPERGFLFDGRVAEDFKLVDRHLGQRRPAAAASSSRIASPMSPTSSSPARIATTSPRSSCRTMSSAARSTRTCGRMRATAEIVANDRVREEFVRRLATFNAKAGGSSERFKRILLLDDPPSLDSGEMTDKGSINQRAALALQAASDRRTLRTNAPRCALFRRASAAEVADLDGRVQDERGPP